MKFNLIMKHLLRQIIRLPAMFLLGFMVLCCSESQDRSSLSGALNPSHAMAQNDAAAKAAANAEASVSRQNAITRAVAQVSPGVVGINVTQIKEYIAQSPFSDDPFFRQFFPERRFRERIKSLGSGAIISNDGYIITNEHVVANAVEIVVTTPGGEEHEATVVGSDYITDIALLKIKGKDYHAIPVGNSDEVIIGEWVIALGNPFGLFDINSEPIVTVGVVSALGQDFGRQADRRVYLDMIQTDAAINSGNSGGPLVNANGEIIGINTWIISGSESMSANIGLGFAIPINRVMRLVQDIKVFGKVDRRFWTGLEVEELSPLIAKYFGLPNWHGVVVSSVARNSPAEAAGLRENDVIVEVNAGAVRNRYDIWSAIEDRDLKGGDVLVLKVFRDGKYFDVRMKLERPAGKRSLN